MNDVTYLPLNTPSVKSYVFRAVLESGDTGWYARCLALAAYSASAWGETQEAALRHLQRTVERIVRTSWPAARHRLRVLSWPSSHLSLSSPDDERCTPLPQGSALGVFLFLVSSARFLSTTPLPYSTHWRYDEGTPCMTAALPVMPSQSAVPFFACAGSSSVVSDHAIFPHPLPGGEILGAYAPWEESIVPTIQRLVSRVEQMNFRRYGHSLNLSFGNIRLLDIRVALER
jgi:hypothetical protein